MSSEFYIGYEEKAPKGYAQWMRWVTLIVLLAICLVAFILVRSQKEFSTSTFELGKLTQLKGILTIKPVPMLTLENESESVLLIDYGKFGAEKTLLDFFRDGSIDGLTVTLEGSLIYGDGKTLMELTNGRQSILDFSYSDTLADNVKSLGQIELIGEIIDPKCYFGVMKPGEGKVHRSCAIRCISGGIPPVLRVENVNGEIDYFILRGQNGQQINQKVLDFVAEPVKVSGELYQFNNWMFLYLNEAIGIERRL